MSYGYQMRAPSQSTAQDGCPCEFCQVSRLVEALVFKHMPPGFVWHIAVPLDPREVPRAFVVRWGDA